MIGLIASLVLGYISTDIEKPNVEASAFFSSRKVERGMVENRDPVYGWEAEIEWYGFHGGVEWCADMTDINGNRGNYNEVTSTFGYERKLLDHLLVNAEYKYKDMNDEGHTQEVEMDAEFPFEIAVPYCSANIDIDKTCGAFYGTLGVKRDFATFYDSLTLTPFVGMGVGNIKRNFEDFECHRNAARDINLGIDAELELYDNISLCGNFTMYDQFTEKARREFDKGFFVVASCALKASF